MIDKNWKKSPWTISLVTAIFSLLLTMGYDYSKNEPILSTVWNIIKWIWHIIIVILNFDLKVWWILIALLVFIIFVYVFDKYNNSETFKPDFYSYREDKLKKWRWTWNWKWSNSKKAWVISNLSAHCPNCDTPMIEHSSIYGLSFDCPRCEFSANDSECEEPYKIERIILDNIDRKRKNNNV